MMKLDEDEDSERNSGEAWENVRGARVRGWREGRWGGVGGNEKEVIGGLFLLAFCRPPSEIFRGETHTKGAFLSCQGGAQTKTAAHV